VSFNNGIIGIILDLHQSINMGKESKEKRLVTAVIGNLT
jgi:hypothetical protein